MSLESARSKLDIMYRDVLGEIDQLLGRTEALMQHSQELVEATRGLPGDLHQSLVEHSTRLNSETVRSLKHVTTQLEAMTAASQLNHEGFDAAFKRLNRLISVLTMLIIFLGGALGGSFLYRLVM